MKDSSRNDGNTISGTFTQAGNSFPLDFERVENAPELNRPQEPKKPYPYNEEEVSYENTQEGSNWPEP